MHESTGCRVDILSEFVDGHLDRSESEVMEAHLQSCSECWLLAEELRAVVTAASELPEEGPEHDLWPAILEGISDSTVIELPTNRTRIEPPMVAATEPPRRGGVFLTNGQLAAAAAAVVLLVGGPWVARSGMTPEPEMAAVETPAGEMDDAVRTASLDDVGFLQFSSQIEELEQVLQDARASLDPNTVRILEKNLGLIDQAIRE